MEVITSPTYFIIYVSLSVLYSNDTIVQGAQLRHRNTSSSNGTLTFNNIDAFQAPRSSRGTKEIDFIGYIDIVDNDEDEDEDEDEDVEILKDFDTIAHLIGANDNEDYEKDYDPDENDILQDFDNLISEGDGNNDNDFTNYFDISQNNGKDNDIRGDGEDFGIPSLFDSITNDEEDEDENDILREFDSLAHLRGDGEDNYSEDVDNSDDSDDDETNKSTSIFDIPEYVIKVDAPKISPKNENNSDGDDDDDDGYEDDDDDGVYGDDYDNEINGDDDDDTNYYDDDGLEDDDDENDEGIEGDDETTTTNYVRYGRGDPNGGLGLWIMIMGMLGAAMLAISGRV